MTTQKAKTYWSLPGGGCSQELNHRGSLARRDPDTCTILGLHCHAMKNKNANHSIQKD